MTTDTEDFELQHESPYSPGSWPLKRLRITSTNISNSGEQWQQDKVTSDKNNRNNHNFCILITRNVM